MRRVCYISGTRADFGLMKSSLMQISDSKDLHLSVIATGMHLFEQYGHTLTEVQSCGFETHVVNVEETEASRKGMSLEVASQLTGFTQVLDELNPDVLLLLGDRGEMLAGAIAALYLNIPVVHIHGGERSGTVDELIRHALSKLSHFHFVATEESRTRLIKMGESEERVFVTGAPGLDEILGMDIPTKDVLMERLNIPDGSTLVSMVYHPVVQNAESAGEEVQKILDALPSDCNQVILMPNSDAGGYAIRERVKKHAESHNHVFVVNHLERELYLSLVKNSDVLVGNSSSGIIEAASFGTPVVNVGERQNNRERNTNTIDVITDTLAIKGAITDCLEGGRFDCVNRYGDGHAGAIMVQLLETLVIDDSTTRKSNAY